MCVRACAVLLCCCACACVRACEDVSHVTPDVCVRRACACAALCVCACGAGLWGCAVAQQVVKSLKAKVCLLSVCCCLRPPTVCGHSAVLHGLHLAPASLSRRPPPCRCAACVQTRNTRAPPQTLAGWPAQSMTINCVRTSRTRRLAKEVRAGGSARPWSEGKSYPRRGMAGMVGSGCGVNAEGVSPTGHGVGSGCGGVNAAPAVLCRPR